MLKDFRISPDTIIWIIIAALLVGNILSYKAGYKNGVVDEKIGWLEDQALDKLKIGDKDGLQRVK